MFYNPAIYLLENSSMEIDWGAVVAALVAAGGIISLWIRMNVSLTEIRVRQQNQSERIDMLEEMVRKQISVDDNLKEVLVELKVGQATLVEQIKSLIERLEKVE